MITRSIVIVFALARPTCEINEKSSKATFFHVETRKVVLFFAHFLPKVTSSQYGCALWPPPLPCTVKLAVACKNTADNIRTGNI